MVDYEKHSSRWIPIVKDKSKSNEISKTHEIKKHLSQFIEKNKNKDAVAYFMQSRKPTN